jgi:hypothetical protein
MRSIKLKPISRYHSPKKHNNHNNNHNQHGNNEAVTDDNNKYDADNQRQEWHRVMKKLERLRVTNGVS